MSENSSLLTVPEVSKRLRISEAGVYRLTQAGTLPSIRVGNLIRFRVADVERVEREGTGPKVQS